MSQLKGQCKQGLILLRPSLHKITNVLAEVSGEQALLTLPLIRAMRAVVPPNWHSLMSLASAASAISSSSCLKVRSMTSSSSLFSEAGLVSSLKTAGSLQQKHSLSVGNCAQQRHSVTHA